jgi:GNAT superfamily N-acetyltransferase
VSFVSFVRRAVTDDLSSLLVLVRAFCAADGHEYHEGRVSAALTPLLGDDHLGQVWVVSPHEDPSRLLGYAVVTWSWSLESGGRDCLLDEIFVSEQGAGIGSELLLHAMSRASEAGAAAMFLETEAHNSMVRRFYARNGFTSEDSVWMRTGLG